MNILSCDEEGINQIVKSYKNGKIIAFPTETVYGIGCDPFNKDSITRIYELKKEMVERDSRFWDYQRWS